MHVVLALLVLCAGTPLGDPIEIGAIAAVILPSRATAGSSPGNDAQAPQQRPPLLLGAAKSTLGHSEAASGLTGIVHAAAAAARSAATPFPHLRSLNPHIGSAMAGAGVPEAAWSLPRQPAGHARMRGSPLAGGGVGSTHAAGGGEGTPGGGSHAAAVLRSELSTLAISGVTAFAFQGTNAHVVLAAPATMQRQPRKQGATGIIAALSIGAGGTAAASAAAQRLKWQRARLWPVPAASLMACGVMRKGSNTGEVAVGWCAFGTGGCFNPTCNGIIIMPLECFLPHSFINTTNSKPDLETCDR